MFTDGCELLARDVTKFPADTTRRLIFADRLEDEGFSDVGATLRGDRGLEAVVTARETCKLIGREPDALVYVCVSRYFFPVSDAQKAAGESSRPETRDRM